MLKTFLSVASLPLLDVGDGGGGNEKYLLQTQFILGY